ncbi:MAG: type II secretion system F family protein [Methanomassiliicoccales archaeon]|nr:MAG: type II secretion system F family protein [Methanomassiliicoccales archaeon]
MIFTSENIPVLISVLVFLSIFLFLLAIYDHLRKHAENRKLIEKIKRGGQKPKQSDGEGSAREARGTIHKRSMRFFGLLGERLGPSKSDELSRMRLNFLKAGIRRDNAPVIFWGVKSFLAILLPACLLLVRTTGLKLMSPSTTLTMCTLLALMGFYLPNLWLNVRTDRRKEKILEGLPDALDLLVVCVEAGMGLDAAINRVAEEIQLSHTVLSDEFKFLNLELRAGKLRRDALRSLARRIDLEDVNSLVTLLIQADRFGTSIAQALRVYSDALRTKRYQRAEEIAAKLPVKLMFPLILFIFPALFVTILGPAAIRVWRIILNH